MMASWQVDPAGVQKIIDDVTADAKALGSTLSSFGDDLQFVVTGTQSAEVASALQAFLDVHSGHISTIQNRVPMVLEAIAGATNAVTAGDDQMASSTQAAAIDQIDGITTFVPLSGGRRGLA